MRNIPVGNIVGVRAVYKLAGKLLNLDFAEAQTQPILNQVLSFKLKIILRQIHQLVEGSRSFFSYNNNY